MLGTSFVLALRAIRRHLMRSFLTTLGIIIGVAAVVTMVTLGNGATAQVQSQISSLGTNLLNVNMGGGFGRGGGAAPRPFDEDDVLAVKNQVGGVLQVAPQAQSSVTAIYEGQTGRPPSTARPTNILRPTMSAPWPAAPSRRPRNRPASRSA